MSNALFQIGAQNLLGKPGTGHSRIDLDGDTISAVFIDSSDDTPVAATDEDYADLAGTSVPATLGTMPTVATINLVGGNVDASVDTLFSSLSGDPCEFLVVLKNTGTASTSALIAMYDTYASGTTMASSPVTPNGGNITVVWNSSGLFSIA